MSAFVSTFWTNAVVSALGVITGVFLARSLGPVGRGELLAIQLIPILLTPFAMIGQGESISFFSAREPANSRTYLVNGIFIASVGAIVFVGIGVCVIPQFLDHYSTQIVAVGLIYLAILPVQAFVGLAYQPFRSIGDFTTWNVLRCLPVLCWCIFVCIYGMIVDRPNSQVLAIGHLVVIVLMALPFLYLATTRLTGGVALSKRSMTSLLQYGVVVIGAALPGFIVSRIDQFVAVANFSLSESGMYAVALSWSTICAVVGQALGSVVLPHIAAEDNGEKRRSNAIESIRIGFLCCVLWSTFVGIITPVFLPLLFGNAFEGAVNVAVVLCIAACTMGFNALLLEVVRALGNPGRLFVGDMSSLLTVAVCYIALSKHLSPVYVGSISAFGNIIGVIATLTVLRKKLMTSSINLIVPSSKDVLLLRQLIVKLAIITVRR